jgi:hypothetical protein
MIHNKIPMLCITFYVQVHIWNSSSIVFCSSSVLFICDKKLQVQNLQKLREIQIRIFKSAKQKENRKKKLNRKK